MQESIETIHAELEERLRFETLLAELSAHFVNLPADRMDSEIEDAQRRICEFLDLDRSALFQVPEREPGVLLLTHIHRVPVPWIFDGNGIQPHRCPAADVSRQDADDARKHDVARDDRRRRLTRNQHPGQLDLGEASDQSTVLSEEKPGVKLRQGDKRGTL